MTDDIEIFRQYSREYYGLDSVFTNIAIETLNFCNRGCGFCPVGIDRKPVRRMSFDVFDSLMVQLQMFGYRGDICLNWYNEPLADARLPAFVKTARGFCPNSYIYFASNGDLLTVKMFRRLIDAGLSSIHVSQYDGAVQANVQEVLDDGYAPSKIRVQIKGPSELKNSRGGLVKDLYILQPSSTERCIRPDEQLIVDAEGNVPLCCNDYHLRECVGNVTQTTLLRLWDSPRLYAVRRILREGKRGLIDLCSKCNEPDASYAASLPKGV